MRVQLVHPIVDGTILNPNGDVSFLKRLHNSTGCVANTSTQHVRDVHHSPYTCVKNKSTMCRPGEAVFKVGQRDS